MNEDEARSVLALIEEARQYTIGLVFEPDLDDDGNDAGWTISYVIRDWPAVQDDPDLPGARLSSAYDLLTAVAAALKPLQELGRSYHRYIDSTLERDRRHRA